MCICCSHHVYALRLNGKMFLAPIDKETQPQHILDLGTGVGNCQFPDAQITGNDLSPVQPTYVPPNVTFEIDDFNEEWLQPSNHFDFVHARALYGSVQDWSQFLKNVYRVLKPGAWFESVETVVEIACDDGSIPKGAPVEVWCDEMIKAADDAGASFDVAGRMEGWCERAGFVEVTQKMFKIPIGPWAKEKYEKTVGSYNLVNMLAASEGFSLRLLTKFGSKMSKSDVEDLLLGVTADLKNKKYHSYFRM
ncbi:hypothetical protein AA313_de0200150 [Arthrobotrys entomopaga]|nr:hypothetical protein AA313_de0200150 [Arthrobotrys entomopaga]